MFCSQMGHLVLGPQCHVADCRPSPVTCSQPTDSESGGVQVVHPGEAGATQLYVQYLGLQPAWFKILAGAVYMHSRHYFLS